MIRKAALQLASIALLLFIALNAYFAISHLRRVRKTTALMVQNCNLQATISSILQDLTDMETAQRGYMVTGDPAYLQPYTKVKGTIGAHFASLRASLADRPEQERSLESQLESIANSKQAEMDHTIALRQNGYRHRAFTIISTNQGKDYMDRARALLSSLSDTERKNFATIERDENADLHKALSASLISNLCLLVLASFLVAVTHYHGKALEQAAAECSRTVAVRDSQLRKLLSALGTQIAAHLTAIETNARLLLETYGGFLPRQGHEYAEKIKDSAIQLEQLRQDLLRESASSSSASTPL